LGEKRFRALQTDKDAPFIAAQGDADAPPDFRRRNGNEHDYLHIFFHPDYDRRLWHRTRSADPCHQKS
jgi:hypothetical protein